MSGSGETGRPPEPAESGLNDSLSGEIRGAKQQLTDLLAKWQRQARGLLAVNNIARVVVSSQGLDEILAAAVEEIEDSLGVARVRVILLDPATGQLAYHGRGGKRFVPRASEESPVLESAVWQVIEGGQSMRLDYVPRVEARPASAGQACTALCVPLLACERIVGAVQVMNKLQHRSEGIPLPFDEQDQEVLEGVAAFVAMAVENARLQEATRTQAAADTLQETVVTLAHYVNNPLQGAVSAAELLKEQLGRILPANEVARAECANAMSLVDVIIENTAEISAVLRLLEDAHLPRRTTYLGSQKMLDIEEELQARIGSANT